MSVAHPRGTSNSNARGNTAARRARRLWLLSEWGWTTWTRCFHCGIVLTETTITVDRIIPGILGGGYENGNIRPACLTCNSIEGSALRDALKRGHDFWRHVQPTLRQQAHVVRWNGKLNGGQVAAIGFLLTDGRFTKARIAYEVGVNPTTVRRFADA